ncbi:transporter [Sphingomonas sp. H39-1-10]|uniref:transporter n=1 Tax=Sphingomonas pollutisoli TaxID=3030829 RepID=UPI0023BA1087|nr:transporter [Sphingomonas pollutisoli]MDF0489831.1 transporter [Sphingomonas pollutisoli]
MRTILFLAATLAAAPALAEDREYCPSRPDLGRPPCTIASGRVSVETALADWTLEKDSDGRTDTVLIADTLVRVGLSDTVEAQVGWTPYGHVRARDSASGMVENRARAGDVTLGAKVNLHNPDGKGLSAAVRPFVTVPVGRMPVGFGDWGAGMTAPVSYELNETFKLQATPEVEAAVDKDGHGRHFAASGTLGLGVELTKALTATIEAQVLRDDDPDEDTTQTFGALSLAWMVGKAVQLDIGGIAGLNRDAPDAEVYLGISRLF